MTLYRDIFDQRAADSLRSDHDSGHPDGVTFCRYCEREAPPELYDPELGIPQYDIPKSEVSSYAQT